MDPLKGALMMWLQMKIIVSEYSFGDEDYYVRKLKLGTQELHFSLGYLKAVLLFFLPHFLTTAEKSPMTCLLPLGSWLRVAPWMLCTVDSGCVPEFCCSYCSVNCSNISASVFSGVDRFECARTKSPWKQGGLCEKLPVSYKVIELIYD